MGASTREDLFAPGHPFQKENQRMASEYGGDRRAAMQARNELYLKGPWAAAELIHQLYQHTEVRLVPAMVLRQSYKAVPQMAREVELGAAPSGAKYP